MSKFGTLLLVISFTMLSVWLLADEPKLGRYVIDDFDKLSGWPAVSPRKA